MNETDTTKLFLGTSLVVQWLRLHASTAEVKVQSLVKELRPCMPCDMTKVKNRKRKETFRPACHCDG